jgi:hypothetical protein
MSARVKPARKHKIMERRAEVARRYLQGETQIGIGLALRVSQATVSIDLAHLRQEWRANAALDIGELQARELARLDQVESEAWAAWERSKQSRETRTTGTDGDKSHARIRKEDQCGDPRYLIIVQNCIERRCALFGLDKPTKSMVMVGGSVTTNDNRLSLTAADVLAAEQIIVEAGSGIHSDGGSQSLDPALAASEAETIPAPE